MYLFLFPLLIDNNNNKSSSSSSSNSNNNFSDHNFPLTLPFSIQLNDVDIMMNIIHISNRRNENHQIHIKDNAST